MSDGTTSFRVFVDGVYKVFTSTEYEAEFGYKPTHPREGERLFGGRYEHKSFAIERDTTNGSGSLGEFGTQFNVGNSTTSSILSGN